MRAVYALRGALSGFRGRSIELRISNGKIWRLRFEPDARRDDEAVVNALRRGGATPQQAKDKPTKFPLVIRSSIKMRRNKCCLKMLKVE